jgi:hypothetical protein
MSGQSSRRGPAWEAQGALAGPSVPAPGSGSGAERNSEERLRGVEQRRRVTAAHRARVVAFDASPAHGRKNRQMSDTTSVDALRQVFCAC